MDQDKITITEDSMDIVYYYQENNDSSGDEDQEIAECTTRTVTVPYDSNRHTFDIRPGEGVNLRYSMKEDGPYTIEELPAYTDAGKYTIYFEASSDSAKSCYGQASLEITKAVTELKLLATPAGSEGAGSVTLKVLKQGISADEPVDITCNDSSITLVKKENDQWTVSLPNKTKTYSFTAKYNESRLYVLITVSVLQVAELGQVKNNRIIISPARPMYLIFNQFIFIFLRGYGKYQVSTLVHAVTGNIVYAVIKNHIIPIVMSMGGSAKLNSGILFDIMLEHFYYIVIEYVCIRSCMHTYDCFVKFICPVCQFIFHKGEIRYRF